jgi:hypothetical protein
MNHASVILRAVGFWFLRQKNVLAKITRKKAILAIAIIAMAAIVGTVVACPNFVGNSQASQTSQPPQSLIPQVNDLALNDSGWQNLDQFLKMSSTTLVVHNVTVQSKGWAFQRIDNETIKEYAVQLNLTIEVGPRKANLIPIVNVTGSVAVHSTSFNAVYTIESGKGVIETCRRVALISAKGVDAQNNPVTFKAEINYFWWGGRTYAFTGKAILRPNGNPMLMLLRYGVAKVQ